MPRRIHPGPIAAAYAFDEEARIFVPSGAPDDLEYSDGDATEDSLLALIRAASDLSLHSTELAARAVDWPTRYHLSPARANLLRPFEPHLRGRTLEVGSGCGALTRYLGELGGEVVALEGSRRRATITAARCRGLDNVTVVHERLERFRSDQPFTAITLVGVLEWASRFAGGEDAARQVVRQAARLLADEGVLLIAIENQLGMKYLAGWPEDHLGAAMIGVNDAYRPGEPRTFGLRDLTALVADGGLRHQAVYAPLPDYKFARAVVTPAGLDDREWSADLASLVAAMPVADPQDPVLPVFSLEQALGLAAGNGLLRELANSFLVVAGHRPVSGATDEAVLAWHFSGNRRPEYLRETRFRRSAHGIAIEHRRLAPATKPEPGAEGFVRHRDQPAAFLPGEVWTTRLGPILNRPGWTVSEVAAWAEPWRTALDGAAGLHRPATAARVPSRLVDATPFNLVHASGEFRFFDLEWEPPWRVEYGYVLFRGLYWSLLRFRSVAEPAAGVPRGVSDLAVAIAHALGTPISPADASRYLDIEADMQHEVAGVPVAKTRESLRRPWMPVRTSLEALAGLEAQVESLREALRQAATGRDDLRREVDRLQSALQEAMDRAEAEREDFTRQLDEASRTYAEAARAHAEAASVHEALQAALRARLAELEDARRSVATALARATTERDEARHGLQAMEDELQAMEDDRADLASRNASLERFAREQAAQLRARQRAMHQVRHDAETRARQALTQAAQAIPAVRTSATSGTPGTSAAVRALARLRDAHLHPQTAVRRPIAFARGLVRLTRQSWRAQVALLAESLLFDPTHYAAVTGVPPGPGQLAHFFTAGDAAGQSPHPLFDAAWYRQRNPDVPAADGVLQHYLRHGGWELRHPHPLFDAHHYLAQWPEGAVHAATPLSHFLHVGFLGAASPHPLFDARFYVDQRPDLVRARVNPLVHYLATATTEMVDPHPLFSTRHYLESNPDVQGANPLDHFVRHGAAEGRSPHPLFDIGFYWQRRPDVHASGENALQHYVRHALDEDVDPHPLFATSFYLAQAPDLRERGINPLAHFLRDGWREGLKPNPWFDPAWYLSRNEDVARDANPVFHYLRHGWREGRDPSPSFSVQGYLSRNPDIAADGREPLTHFLRYGQAEGRVAVGAPVEPPDTPHAPIVLQVSGRSTTPPAVLCVSHVSPWPVRAGNEYRLSRLLDHFQARGHGIVLVLAPLANEPPAPGAFEHLAATIGNVVLCRPDGRIEYRLRDVPDVLSSLADLPAATAASGADAAFEATDRGYCHDTVFTAAVALSRALGPSIVVAEYVFMSRVFTAIGAGSLRIVDTHDVFSQKGHGVAAYGIRDVGLDSAAESRLLTRADVVLGIHASDAEALRALAPRTDVIVAGVDAAVGSAVPWPDHPVAFLPASGNPMNIVGLRDFLRFAWPRVRAAVPEAELRVAGGVGRAVPPGTPGVAVLGHVPDLAHEYAAARVVINPAVAGTGLKIKTVEAVAALRPVVGWPHNRDGLPASLIPFVAEAGDWHDFADQVARHLVQAQSPFDERAVAAITRELSPATVYRELDERVARFLARARVGQE
ncbi:MAG: glycosyltransferase [Vicinamibacterales bacterium]